jgi:hypothetical protein
MHDYFVRLVESLMVALECKHNLSCIENIQRSRACRLVTCNGA